MQKFYAWCTQDLKSHLLNVGRLVFGNSLPYSTDKYENVTFADKWLEYISEDEFKNMKLSIKNDY